MSENIQDFIRYEGVNAQGFGTIPRLVMRDKELPLGAKGIYAYFCALAGGGESSFPNRNTIVQELGISIKTYYKYRDMLVERGYLYVTHEYKNFTGTPVRHTVYVIASTIAKNKKDEEVSSAEITPPTNTFDLKSVLRFGKKKDTKKSVYTEIQEDKTVENEEESFPQTPGQDVSGKNYYIRDVENSDFPQTPGQDVSGNSAYIRNFTTPIKEKNITYNSTLVDNPSNLTNEDNLACDYNDLSATAVNRNRLADGRIVYEKLREEFSKEIIEAAWAAEQGRCEGREGRYYTQLYRWLKDFAKSDCERILQRQKTERDKTRTKAFRELLNTNKEFEDLVRADNEFQEQVENQIALSDEEMRLGRERIERIALLIDEHVDKMNKKAQVTEGGQMTPQMENSFEL